MHSRIHINKKRAKAKALLLFFKDGGKFIE